MKLWKRESKSDTVKRGIEDMYPRLWRYCVVLTGDKTKADDLAQSACLRAIEKADLFDIGTHFDRWMFRLTQRLWINEMRKQAVRLGGGLAAPEDVDLIDPNPTPEANSLGREVIMEIMRLPEAQRTTVLLVYGEGYNYRDAAMVLDIPLGTVMSRLAVARGKLCQKFRDESAAG